MTPDQLRSLLVDDRVRKLQAYAAIATALERSLSPAFHATHGGYLETMKVVDKIRAELLALENELWGT